MRWWVKRWRMRAWFMRAAAAIMLSIHIWKSNHHDDATIYATRNELHTPQSNRLISISIHTYSLTLNIWGSHWFAAHIRIHIYTYPVAEPRTSRTPPNHNGETWNYSCLKIHTYWTIRFRVLCAAVTAAQGRMYWIVIYDRFVFGCGLLLYKTANRLRSNFMRHLFVRLMLIVFCLFYNFVETIKHIYI